MALNELNISNLGLLNINRKIIDSRKYESNLIENIGDVSVFENKASNFSIDSYLCKKNLVFSQENTLVTCYGNFSKTGDDQILWVLKGEDTSIELHFCDDQVKLAIDEVVVIQFSYLQLEDNTDFKVLTNFSGNTVSITLYVHNLVFEKSVILSDSFNIANADTLYLGNEPNSVGNFWIGSIDLENFSIKENSNLVYSPSTSYPLAFSKILISDGEFKLTDSSFPIANHIYEYNISEITRSGGTLLLTAQVADDAKLIIKEIGLYATTTEGEILYGIISNLNINKGAGVPYDLIFTMNIYASFVNVVGFPDFNSFVINEPELALFQDFSTIKELLLYVYTNLERIIAMNAMNIGYNRAQVFYKLHKEMDEQEECYYTIENFAKIANKLQRIVNVYFNPNMVDVQGNLIVPENGETKGFSETDYISSSILFDSLTNWEVDASFELETKESGTILTLRGTSAIQPLLLQSYFSSEEDKVYFYVKMGKDETEDEFIIDNSIFEIKLNVRYFIKLRYIHNSNTPADSYYEILISDDGESYQEIFTKYSERIMLPVKSMSIGVESSYNNSTNMYSISNPFKGTIYVNSLKIISNSEEWTPTTSEIINDTELIQFYHIPDYFKSRYILQDLCNPNLYKLTVLETSIEGDGDLIDFSYKDGFSLCMNVSLKDITSKVLLAKTNLTDRPYFLLAFLNSTIYFIFFTKSKSIVLSKELSEDEIVSYLSNPILLSVVLKGNKVCLYNRTTLIASFQGIFGEFRNYHHSSITNFIQYQALYDICSSLNLGNIDNLEEYVKEVEGNQGRYIKNILAVQGALTEEELYFISILMNA